MRPKSFSWERARISYIQHDTGICKMYWKCLLSFKNQVIGKVEQQWHKHAPIVKPDSCNGYVNSINTCKYNAYSISDGA